MQRPRRTRSRLAWLVGGSLFSVVLLGYGTTQAAGLLAHDRHHTHREYTGDIQAVDITAEAGSVTVYGTDASAVTVDTSVSEGLMSPTDDERLEAGRLVLRSRCEPVLDTFCGVDYTVYVPHGLAVRASAGGGGVHVSGVDGALDLSSSGGGVTVTGGTGRMSLHSSGGSVHGSNLTSADVDAGSSGGGVRLEFDQPPSDVKAGSSGGGVTVVVPNTPTAYHVVASSSGGSAHADVRTDPAASRTIQAHSSGGSVRVEYPPHP
jgi:hypothetical protein